jgi:PAS domain S-box-containing protein
MDSILPPAILDTLDVAVTIHHPETGAILGVNTAKEELYGYSEDELLDMTVGDYSANESKYTHEQATQLINAAANGTPQSFEWHVKKPSGELFWAHVKLHACTIDGRECVVALSQDISTIKEKERRLRLFYRIFRHNLRNDMNVILGYAEQLEQAIEDDDLKMQIQTVNNTAKKVATLSDSVTEIDQITNRTLADRSPTKVMAIVEDVASELGKTYPHITLAIDGTEDVWVNVDDNLRVALRQILKNAVEHSDQQQPTLLITIAEIEEREQAQIKIADDGPGMPEIESQIFESEDELTSVSHSSGIGLWIIKFCAESLGGYVRVEDNEPRGSVIKFTLPLLSEY